MGAVVTPGDGKGNDIYYVCYNAYSDDDFYNIFWGSNTLAERREASSTQSSASVFPAFFVTFLFLKASSFFYVRWTFLTSWHNMTEAFVSWIYHEPHVEDENGARHFLVGLTLQRYVLPNKQYPQSMYQPSM